MESSPLFSLQHIFTLGHLLGVLIGAGAAFLGDFLFLRSIRDQKITAQEMSRIRKASKIVWIGLAIIIIFGIGLFSLDVERYLGSAKFLSKMSIVAILVANGVAFHFLHIPRLIRHVDLDLRTSTEFMQKRKYLLISGAISSTSWLSALVLGALNRLPYSYTHIFGTYLVIVLGAICSALLLRNYIFPLRVKE